MKQKIKKRKREETLPGPTVPILAHQRNPSAQPILARTLSVISLARGPRSPASPCAPLCYLPVAVRWGRVVRSVFLTDYADLPPVDLASPSTSFPYFSGRYVIIPGT